MTEQAQVTEQCPQCGRATPMRHCAGNACRWWRCRLCHLVFQPGTDKRMGSQ